MRSLRRLTIAFSIVLLTVLGLWFISDHQNGGEMAEEGDSVLQSAMSEIMAEDLSLTIQMFLHQIEDDLERWEKEDWSNDELKEKMTEEIEEHPHVNGFVLYSNGEELQRIGEVTASEPNEILHYQKGNGASISDPFIEKGKKRLLIGAGVEDLSYIAEVDLSFIEGYVKDIASLADANGQFFIGEDVDVSLSQEEANLPYAKTEVPEIGWNLYVQSDAPMEEEEHFKKGELIIELAKNINREQWAAENEVAIIDQFNGKIIIRDTNRSTEELMELWSNDPSIMYMEPNYMYSKQHVTRSSNRRSVPHYFGRFDGFETPNDEFYEPYQWNLTQIFTEPGWNISIGERGVPIAIIDSGIDPDHKDLAAKITDGYNAFEDNGAYEDDNGHGTHVAGIAGAITNNMDGIAGVSWYNPLLAVKSLDHNAEGSSLSIAKGIVWAVDNGAKVINLSLGDSHDSDIMYEAIKYAYDKDVVLIAASGNDNVDTPMYPAAYEEVLAVAAVDPHREKAVFSNFGYHIDVTAPGEHIPSTYVGDQYVIMSGTSMSAPHVAGLAGLIRSLDPNLTNEEIYDIICYTSDDLGVEGYDPYYGFGEINIQRALEEVSISRN
ncbi:subtilisin family serine protease [Evansella vedderi]|uniref:Subtilisin family serine protease n=1 Tax=Evansella vedderi TaxID=38282 RepID=A0ABT9ZVE1_9BACI|nr:S8 family peptidase [Evansella vedderi]MDQ0255211.1 subtilisin family serine protease [Evansella vedderi]